MAQLFRPPEGFPECPKFEDYNGEDFPGMSELIDKWAHDEHEWVLRLSQALREMRPGNDLIGREVSWHRGDGFARYLICSVAPNIGLIHLPVGDAWEVEAPLIRGVIMEDIQAMQPRLPQAPPKLERREERGE